MSEDKNKKEEALVSETAHRYVVATKGWKADEYRLEPRGLTPDQSQAVVKATYLADLKLAVPGGGKSVLLYVDRQRWLVVKELAFQ